MTLLETREAVGGTHYRVKCDCGRETWVRHADAACPGCLKPSAFKALIAAMVALLLPATALAADVRLQIWLMGQQGFSYSCRGYPGATHTCYSTRAGWGDTSLGFRPVEVEVRSYKGSGYSGDVCEIKLRHQIPTAPVVDRPRGVNGPPSFPADTGRFGYGYQTPPYCNVAAQTCPGDRPCFCRSKTALLGSVADRLFTWVDGVSDAIWIPGYTPPHSGVSLTAGIGGVNRTDLDWNVLGVDLVSSQDMFEDELGDPINNVPSRILFATAESIHEGRCNTIADYSHYVDCVRGYLGYPWATQEEYNQQIGEIHDDSAQVVTTGFSRISATAKDCTGTPLSVEIMDDDVDDEIVVAGHANAGASATLYWNPRGSQFQSDNCIEIWNADQKDTDSDGIGDACDMDYDDSAIEIITNPAEPQALILTTVPDSVDEAELIACQGCTYTDACWTDSYECEEKDHIPDGVINASDTAQFDYAETGFSEFGNFGTSYNWSGIDSVPFLCEGTKPGSGSGYPAEIHPTDGVIGAKIWIVEIEHPSSVAFERAAAQARGAVLGRQYRGHALHGFVMRGSREVALVMSKRPHVRRVFPSVALTVHAVGSWGQDRSDQRDLPLDSTYSTSDGADGDGKHVYIFDTGIDPDHSQLSGRIGDYYDALTQQENVAAAIEDGHGHGTHVAGTIASTTYGLALGATLHPVKVCDSGGTCMLDDIIDGMDWATGNAQTEGYGHVVGSMSLGGPAFQSGSDPDLDYFGPAICDWIDAGHTMVVSAGNDATTACWSTPSRVDKAITVAASTSLDKVASFSNIGECADLYAPGMSIPSLWKEGGTATKSGTSMSAPHVAAAAAIHLERSPTDTPAELAQWVIGASSVGRIVDNGPDPDDQTWTPNRLLYVQPVNDADSDGTPDQGDGCLNMANAPPLDCDQDVDGYGDRCDGDFDNDGVVNFVDTVMFGAAQATGISVNGEDMNCDGTVNFADNPLFIAQHEIGTPGPSGLPCAGNGPCP